MTARRWFSNCEVTAPSWVQWPVLCGRIASSLTSTRPSVVSNSSTARMPVTPSSPAIRSAISCARPARSGSRSGAGATTSRQMPSTCVDATTGYAAAWPLGERATSADSSRRKSTSSSASSPHPGLARPPGTPRRTRRPTGRTRRPCRRSRRGWSSARTATRRRRANSATSATDPTTRCAGTARRARPAGPRITALSWACTSASGPGRTAIPASLERVQVLGRHVLVVEGDDAGSRR